MSGVKKNLFLGIDIGASAVKIVLLEKEKSGRIRIVHALCESYEQTGDAAGLGQAAAVSVILKKFLRKEKDLRTIRTGIAIAGQSAFVRMVKVPATASQKLRQIVLYETQQQVPFPIKDVVWDFQIYGRDKNNLSVLLAAVKKELILSVTAVARTCGLEVEFVDVSNLSLYNCLQYFYRDLSQTLVLDLGAKTTNIVVINGGKVWTRSLPIGGEDITEALSRALSVERAEAEQIKKDHGKAVLLYFGQKSTVDTQEQKIAMAITGVLTDMTNEIVKTLNFYKSQHSFEMNFQKVLITGGVSKIENIDKFFENSLAIPTEKVDYFNFLHFRSSVEVNVNEFVGPAIGLALRGQGRSLMNLNLLPPEELQYKSIKRKIPFLIGSAGAILLFLFMLLGFVNHERQLNENYLRVLETIAGRFDRDKETFSRNQIELARLRNRIGAITPILSGKREPVTVLEKIGAAMPESVWVNELSIVESERRVRISGSAETIRDIEVFQQRLSASEGIQDVAVAKVGKEGDNLVSFSLTVQLRPGQG
ncbi:MAG: type IV pilus assembly protein PilM [Candidatus Omnitrophica bacterium]|nr:type IV pilus assembly protein PilM [Candidatus Omnitrophota bacterium]